MKTKTRSIPMDHFVRSEALAAKLESPLAASLAKNFLELLPIHDVVVRYLEKDKVEILAGETRFAGHVLNQAAFVTCKVVECDDQEAKRITAAENALRRHDTEEQKSAMKELVELMKQERHEGPTMRPPILYGKHKGSRVREVAQERGVNPNSLRVAVWRDQIREEAHAAGMTMKAYKEWKKEGGLPRGGAPLAPPAADPVLPLQMTLGDEFKITVATIQRNVDEAAGATRRVAKMLSCIDPEKLPIREEYQRAIEQLGVTAAQLQALRPFSLCPACKGLTAAQRRCATCRSAGYVTKEEYRKVPRELLSEDSPVVLLGGKFVAVDDLAEEQATEPESEGELDMFAGLE